METNQKGNALNGIVFFVTLAIVFGLVGYFIVKGLPWGAKRKDLSIETPAQQTEPILRKKRSFGGHR